MVWEYILCSLLYALIGYLLGSISWAIICSKRLKKEDIRTKDSGNAGATNALRNYGYKIGALVFVLDIAKMVFAVIITWVLKTYTNSSFLASGYVQFSALFVIIGHCWPLYFNFKGGKGAASTAGLFLVMNWVLFLVGAIVFLSIIKKTKKVSIGSIIAPLVLLICQIAFAFIPHMNDHFLNHFMQEPYWWVNTLLIVLVIAIVIWKHKANIKRLVEGKERSL